MEDSFKGLIITLTMIGLFTTSILSFIVLFPQEQGISFSDLQSNNTYLYVNNSNNLDLETELTTIQNSSQSSFDQWDITQGYMGSNTIKQGSSSNVVGLNGNIFSILILIGTKLFGSGSPIVYAITLLLSLSGIVIVYTVYKLVRQGQ